MGASDWSLACKQVLAWQRAWYTQRSQWGGHQRTTMPCSPAPANEPCPWPRRQSPQPPPPPHYRSRSEGFHNVGYSQNLDARLTERGWDQAHALGRHMYSQQPTAGVQLVVVSPMARTLETAAGIFGIDPSLCAFDPPTMLMAAQDAQWKVRTAHGGLSLRPGVKLVAQELCRERLGALRAAAGRPAGEAAAPRRSRSTPQCAVRSTQYAAALVGVLLSTHALCCLRLNWPLLCQVAAPSLHALPHPTTTAAATLACTHTPPPRLLQAPRSVTSGRPWRTRSGSSPG